MLIDRNAQVDSALIVDSYGCVQVELVQRNCAQAMGNIEGQIGCRQKKSSSFQALPVGQDEDGRRQRFGGHRLYRRGDVNELRLGQPSLRGGRKEHRFSLTFYYSRISSLIIDCFVVGVEGVREIIGVRKPSRALVMMVTEHGSAPGGTISKMGRSHDGRASS